MIVSSHRNMHKDKKSVMIIDFSKNWKKTTKNLRRFEFDSIKYWDNYNYGKLKHFLKNSINCTFQICGIYTTLGINNNPS